MGEEQGTTQEDTRGVVVGVDIGGTKIALLCRDIETGRTLKQDRMPTPADAGPDAMIQDLVDAIWKAVEESGRAREDLRAVGVAVPGLVETREGRVIQAGNLKGWVDIPLRPILTRALGVPVWVDQDANAAALGEHWCGGAVSMDSFVFLALGTGVGAGIFINGKLHHGYHDAAGEVGNFVVGREYLGKDRKGHGNLEMLVGSPAIKRRARQQAGDDLSAAEAIDKGDDDARLAKEAERVADYVAIAVINIAALLDPHAIIFGGGTASAGDDLLGRVRQRVSAELARPPALMCAVLGEDAQLYGAIYGALTLLDPALADRAG